MQKIISIFSKVLLIIVLLLPAVIFQLAATTDLVANIILVIQNYFWLYFTSLVFLKALSMIYPPLPGVALTLVSIPLIGWEKAYITDVTGSTIGATVSYFLGKKYGYSLITILIGARVVEKIKQIKLKKQNQVEAAIFFRFATGGVLSDGLAWGASLIGFRFIPFIIGYVVSHVITTIPVFYFISASISFNSWVMFLAVAVFAWFFILKYKGRYFE